MGHRGPKIQWMEKSKQYFKLARGFFHCQKLKPISKMNWNQSHHWFWHFPDQFCSITIFTRMPRRWVCGLVHFEDKCRTGNDPAAVSLPQVNGPGYNWHSPPPAQCLVIFLSHHSTLFSLCRTFEEDPGLSVALCRLVNRCYPPALKWSRADELTSRDQAIARLQMDRRLGPGSICLHWRSNCNVEYHQLQSCLL